MYTDEALRFFSHESDTPPVGDYQYALNHPLVTPNMIAEMTKEVNEVYAYMRSHNINGPTIADKLSKLGTIIVDNSISDKEEDTAKLLFAFRDLKDLYQSIKSQTK